MRYGVERECRESSLTVRRTHVSIVIKSNTTTTINGVKSDSSDASILRMRRALVERPGTSSGSRQWKMNQRNQKTLSNQMTG